MIRLLTFDAAGTLIDHSWDPAGLAIEAAAAAGVSVEREIAREKYEAILVSMSPERADVELRGDPAEIRAHWRRGIAQWLTELGEDPEVSREIHEHAERAVLGPNGGMWRLYPDVLSALDLAKEAGVVMGVLSNWDRTLHVVLSNLRIADRFAIVIASLEHGFEKPDPEIFREAERQAGVSREACCHIGDDYLDDVRGAADAGWRSVHLVRPGGTLVEAVEEALS